MIEANYWAVVAAAVAAFAVAALWYSPLLFGGSYEKLRGIGADSAVTRHHAAVEPIGELARNLVGAFVLAYFMVRLDVADWLEALQLGLWVWIGFQAMVLIGAVVHENMPFRLYAIHAGDALAKTLAMSLVLGIWR